MANPFPLSNKKRYPRKISQVSFLLFRIYNALIESTGFLLAAFLTGRKVAKIAVNIATANKVIMRGR